MDYTTGYFRETFTPCSEQRLTEIEESLGLQLPEGYRELLRQTGGGDFDYSLNLWAPLESYKKGYWVAIDKILGNHEVWSIEKSPEDMGIDGWGAPGELLIFGFSTSGPNESFGINYGLQEFPLMSIVYVFLDSDNEIVKVADSFEEFMGMLTTD
ncbi:SMI1/KNR4 family protein, partial [Corynebacterium variabile]|uniref:SMI1/KNR4 family protein n=1 Tax=Corynebacterium variabile TaxID=1727 RepID=UPI00114493FE